MGGSISVFVWGLGGVGLVLVYVPGGLGCGGFSGISILVALV